MIPTIPSVIRTLPDGRRELTNYVWQWGWKVDARGRRIRGSARPVKLLRVDVGIYE